MNNRLKIKTLSKLFFRLETHSRNGSNTKLFLMFLSYFVPGILVPLLLFKQNQDPNGYEYAFVTYLFFSVVAIFTVISEFDNMVISKSEHEVLSLLPVSDNLIVEAKLQLVLKYVSLICVPLLLPSATFYTIILNSFKFGVLYFVSGFAMLLFFVSLLLLIYVIVLKNINLKSVSSFTMTFQISLILLLMVGYQFISFSVTDNSGGTISSYFTMLKEKNLLDFFPQAWFAFVPTRFNFKWSFSLLGKSILPFVLMLTSVYALRFYFTDNYSTIKERFLHSKYFEEKHTGDKKRFLLLEMWSVFVRNIYLRTNYEKASYGLMSDLFRRDRFVKLNIIPVITIPVGLTIFALLSNQLPSPFGKDFLALKPVFHISLLLAVLVVVNTSILGLKISSSTQAAWIYDSYPIKTKRAFSSGFRKFFTLYLILPICLIMFLLFALKIPLHYAFVHTLFFFAVCNLYNTLFHAINTTLPFTKENTIFNSLNRLSSMFVPFVFGSVFVLVQVLVYSNVWTALASVFGIFVLTFIINHLSFSRG